MSWQAQFRQWAASGAIDLPEAGHPVCLTLNEHRLQAAALAKLLSRTGKDAVLVVMPDGASAEAIADELGSMLGLLEDRREIIPVPEVSGGRRQWCPENEASRCAALQSALSGQKAVFIASAATLLLPTLSPKGFSRRTFTLRKGQVISPSDLGKKLVELDYDHEFEVGAPGEFASRGGVFDLFSPLYADPVRIEFWGDEIESMRFFSAESQRSAEEIDQMRVIPRGSSVMESRGSETARVSDYFPASMPVVLCDTAAAQERLRGCGEDGMDRMYRDFMASPRRVFRVEPPELTGASGDGAAFQLDADAVAIGEELSGAVAELEGAGIALWHWQQLRNTLVRWHESGYRLVACCSGAGELDRFREMMSQEECTAALPVEMVHWELPQGMLFPDQRLAMLGDQEIFGRQGVRRRRRQIDYRYERSGPGEILELEDGAFAVHVNYGICRYHGVHLKSMGGEEIEAIELEFADDRRIYVPLEQSFLVSRYVGGSKNAPMLSDLGGNRWRNACHRAENAAWDLASELIRMEAMRASSPGYQFRPSPDWERAFAASFPYELTADQQAAVEACYADMASPKPMDRLLCGDVGYGKTEVALRAAFRAVMNGKQVAMLVPTTVLAQQHYQTFVARLREFPIRVGMLSRFCSAAEQRRVAKALSLGEMDIVVGTHRLLSADIKFANPGLLIIDEEQRFGVKHKQRLKAMRSSIDVLTMSATPVPRTLYLSLSGIRNLSTIMTAPQNRLPVVTVVANEDWELVRQAIRREMERSGQVFYLHNRVYSIEKCCDILRSLVPEARFAVAHGQMTPEELERIMTDFVAGRYDVLVSTTIVESGIDIPNANTIIIDRADRFGLSELYQLRGRVGRTCRQAFAYMMLPPLGGVLPANARERLAAIKRFTHLGAGLRLAMKDLEIRGAGNILGQEQSGHIAAVGFELYCQLLKEAVSRLKNDSAAPLRNLDVRLEMVTSSIVPVKNMVQACIPPQYVGDEAMRIKLYRQLQTLLTPEEVAQFGEGLRDRFGPLPSAVQRLLQCHRVKAMARSAGAVKVSTAGDRLVIETPGGLWRDRSGQIPELHGKSPEERLDEVESVVGSLKRR